MALQARGRDAEGKPLVQLTVQVDTPWKSELSILFHPAETVKDVILKAFERSSLKEPETLPSDVVLRLHGSDVDLDEEETLAHLPRKEVGREQVIMVGMFRKAPLDPDVLLEASVFTMAIRGAECVADNSLPASLRLPIATIPKQSCPFGYRFRLIQATGLLPNRFVAERFPKCYDVKSLPAKKWAESFPPRGSRVVVEASIGHCGCWLCPPVTSPEVPWSMDPDFNASFDFAIRIADLPATARVCFGVFLLVPNQKALCLGSLNWLPVDHRRVLKTGVRRLTLWTEKEPSLFDVPYGPPSPLAPELICEVDPQQAPVVFPGFSEASPAEIQGTDGSKVGSSGPYA